MLDIRLIRENPEKVKELLLRKEYDASETIDKILTLDQQRRDLIAKTEGWKAEQNAASKSIPMIKKNGGNIQEVLAHLGATASVFHFFNAQIEREIRNNENRATNCVAENIGRSMRAGARQTAAIRYLAEQELLLSLSDDLRYTAHLRLDNPEATLAELAAMHTPPITKSGLNHRLEKIMAFYEKALRKAEGEIKP